MAVLCRNVCSDAIEMGYLVGEPVAKQFDVSLIFLSLLIAAMGSHTTLTICELMKYCEHAVWFPILVTMAGVSFGVNTVWCMHLIGVQAMTLSGGKISGATEILPVHFDMSLIIISALAAWAMSTLGIYIMSGRKLNNHRRGDKKLVARLILASLVLASGVCTMHYVGMASQKGLFRMEYDAGFATLSIVLTLIASSAGILILGVCRNDWHTRILSSILISGAVNSMHYTGMIASTYVVEDHEGIVLHSSATPIDGLAVVAVAMIVNNALQIACTRYTELLKVKAENQVAAEVRVRKLVKEAQRCVAHLNHPMHITPVPHFLSMNVDDAQVRRGTPKKQRPTSEHLIILDNVEDVEEFKIDGNLLTFFSYEILEYNTAGPNLAQLTAMKRALVGIAEMEATPHSKLFVWLDSLSIPQYNVGLMRNCIGALYNYARLCDKMVIICPLTTQKSLGTVADHNTVKTRLWCRVEQLSFGVAVGTDSMYLHKGEQLEPLPDDWMESICNVFDSNSSCCRMKHPDGLTCDRQNVVLPLLQMCYEHFLRQERGNDAFWSALLTDHSKVMFPKTIIYETRDSTEVHDLFGDSINLLRKIAKDDAYNYRRMDAFASERMSLQSKLSVDYPSEGLRINNSTEKSRTIVHEHSL